jgi:hypothetical protein
MLTVCTTGHGYLRTPLADFFHAFSLIFDKSAKRRLIRRREPGNRGSEQEHPRAFLSRLLRQFLSFAFADFSSLKNRRCLFPLTFSPEKGNFLRNTLFSQNARKMACTGCREERI